MPDTSRRYLDLDKTNLYGEIGAIICWYLDEENMPCDIEATRKEEPSTFAEMSKAEIQKMQRETNRDSKKEQRRIGRIVSRIPELVAGQFDEISGDDLWDVWDALGSYGGRSKTLDDLYKNLDKEIGKRSKLKRSKSDA